MKHKEEGRRQEVWGSFRLSVVGQLLASPPAWGKLEDELKKLAAREWKHPLTGDTRKTKSALYNIVPWAIFTHPQIAHVGMTGAEALQTGKRIKVGKNYYSMTAYGYAMGYEPNDPDDGFVKMIADETGKILGVHIVGPHAAILIQSFVYLMNAGFTCSSRPDHFPIPQQTGSRFCLEAKAIETIDQSMVIHPALSEVAAWVTEELKWVHRKNV